MRTIKQRIYHAIFFEIFGLIIFIPSSALLFNHSIGEMGIIGILSATAATLWNFIYNILFDKGMLAYLGTVIKNIPIRVLHTVLFELGLIVILIPMIAYILNIDLLSALIMDIAIVLFYLIYSFVFNIIYDKIVKP